MQLAATLLKMLSMISKSYTSFRRITVPYTTISLFIADLALEVRNPFFRGIALEKSVKLLPDSPKRDELLRETLEVFRDMQAWRKASR